VREIRAPEVLAGLSVDAIVLPQHEPSRQGRLPLGHPPREGRFGSHPDLVDPTGEPGAPARTANDPLDA
jgi:hypothetical protein